MTQKHYVTTPIYYVNDRPHIGHVYTTTIADIIARYRRLCGDDVFFLTGTDEHAAKVVDSAAERGISTQEWADKNAGEFEQTFARLELTNDDFIRTSQQRHKDRVREYVAALLESGDVYLGDYEGWYDAGQEEYVPENKATEYEFKSPFNGKPLVRKKEKNYFFKLSAYREPLLTLLEKGEKVDGCSFDVQPNARKNEIIERIRSAEDVPISRDVAGAGLGDWCITVPGDDAHAIYVWIDALFNYLTAVDTPDRRHYWPADAQLIAKDILWFHAAIWPAMLLALRRQPGHEWIDLPGVLYVHSFWISEGQKMSKTLGNFVDLEKLDHYVETFGLDALRWFLGTQGPLGTTDSDFSEARFIETYNAELANTIGNCSSRVAKMIGKYFDGVLPPRNDLPDGAVKDGVDDFIDVDDFVRVARVQIEELNLGAYGATVRGFVSEIDGYIERTSPFKMWKDEDLRPAVANILYNCAEALRVASVLLWPLIPDRSQEMWRRLGCDDYVAAVAGKGSGSFDEWTTWGLLQPGTSILQGDPLFPRYQVKK